MENTAMIHQSISAFQAKKQSKTINCIALTWKIEQVALKAKTSSERIKKKKKEWGWEVKKRDY